MFANSLLFNIKQRELCSVKGFKVEKKTEIEDLEFTIGL